MKKLLMMIIVGLIGAFSSMQASDRDTRIQVATGLLYERGWDLTVSVEHETSYHNAWEYFVNVYLKWEECNNCHHVCPKSFWQSYNTWGVGCAYKPAVVRTRNTTGNLRLGASIGSDRHEVLGGVHVGYEHNYALRNGMTLFWQVKSDLVINGKDLFRTGVAIGIKFPLK